MGQNGQYDAMDGSNNALLAFKCVRLARSLWRKLEIRRFLCVNQLGGLREGLGDSIVDEWRLLL